MDRFTFKNLLLASYSDSFLFNGRPFPEIDRASIGCPLSCTLADIFLGCLEAELLRDCPMAYKPIFYNRHVDDTCVLFKYINYPDLFLIYLNKKHPNIKITLERKNDNQLSILDIVISNETDLKCPYFAKPHSLG